MSSARSIATTIQRRAGDQTNQRSVNPYQSQPVTVKSKSYPYQQNTPQQGVASQVKQQLTVSEAIGLITIRLSKLEEQSNEAQYNNVQYDNNNNNNNNNDIATESEVITGILSRMDLLETNVKSCLSLNSELRDTKSELRDTKDLLVKIMFKIENQYSETTSSIEKLNANYAEQFNISHQNKHAHETFVAETKINFDQCDNRVNTVNDTLEALVAETAVQFDKLTVKADEIICANSDNAVAVSDDSSGILTHTICLEE